MHGELPHGGSAHREAAHRDSIVVDAIVFANGIEGLERVDLARQLVRVAEASVRMQHEGVGRCDLAIVLRAIVEEIDLAQILAATVKPEVEPMLLSAVKLVRRGDEQPDRLNRAVDLRDVTPHDAPGLLRPRSVASQQLVGSLLARF